MSLSSLMNALGVAFMRLLGRLPLGWVRALGWLLGQGLHLVAVRRRRIARINLALCFPSLDAAELARAVRGHFVCFAQAWLDRGWLWEGAPARVRSRIRIVGDLDVLAGDTPTVVFAPHFVGLDAGWTALTQQLDRRFCTIYAEQLNPDVDRWMLQGRLRFGQPHVVPKRQGVRPVVAAVRAGEPLYLLPDMDHGRDESVFVPFFGVSTATITSLSRLARLGRARVVPVTSRLTPEGYEIEIHPAWADYPTEDVYADTARMNAELQRLIEAMPSQYYWVHKRFKTRPEGEASVYGGRD